MSWLVSTENSLSGPTSDFLCFIFTFYQVPASDVCYYLVTVIIDSSSGTIGYNELFILQAALVITFYHSNRQVTNAMLYKGMLLLLPTVAEIPTSPIVLSDGNKLVTPKV